LQIRQGATGEGFQSGNHSPQNSYIEAFLLSESNSMFTVFTKDLMIRTFQKTNALPHQKIGFEDLNLAKSVTAYLNSTNMTGDQWRVFGQQLKEGGQAFVVAWGCEKNGLHDLAEKLFRKTASNQNKASENGRHWKEIRNYIEDLFKKGRRKPSFIEELESQFGETMMWRAVLAFEDPKTSRKDLLNKFDDIVEKYPHCKHVPQARENILILRRMLLEDQAHALKPAITLSKMTKDEQVSELIFQLREQNGRQFSQPGACDIFGDPRGEDSPASQLMKLGYDAVPQLLKAVESKSFSRSVGFHRSFYFSHHVMSVGDCALAVLNRVAGRVFQRAASTALNSSKDGKPLTTKVAAEAWWEEFKQKGEKVMLIAGTERGDWDSPQQAELLAKRYPHEAISAVAQGARRATNSWVRTRLVELASSTPFLTDEVTQGPTLGSRLAAAKGLRHQGKAAGLKAMIGGVVATPPAKLTLALNRS